MMNGKLMVWISLMGFLACAGCQSQSGAVSEAGNNAEASEAPAALRGADELLAEVCSGRKPCVAMQQWKLEGTGLEDKVVQEIALHQRGDEGREANTGDCAPFEYWLVSTRARAEKPTKLLRVCNDGYGARGIGEDSIVVEGGVFIHGRSGGSNWGWNETRQVDLATLKLSREEQSGYWTVGPNTRAETWDWTHLAGHVRWEAPRCEDEERVDAFAYDWIPQISVPEAFRKDGWKTTSLGACAVKVDSRAHSKEVPGGGFVIHGTAANTEGAHFLALMASPAELYFEVYDPAWVLGGDAWLKDDHLEIWTGDAMGYMDHCLDSRAPKQWGVSLHDGQVYSAKGSPDPRGLTVERVPVYRGGDEDGPIEAIRLKIRFAAAPAALTLVYSDSFEGTRQDRLIATSDLKFGDGATLGQVKVVPAESGRCVVREEALVFEDLRVFEAMD